MTHRYWPLFDLRLASPDLALRPMAEDDLAAIADLLPDDVEQDPAATTYPIGNDRIRRGMVSHQHYWKAYGTWRPAAWRLNFAVSAAGQIIGVQELEGNDFRTLRTVDTSSFLVPSARGRSYGKQMRAAVLALAFGPLHARAAITSAWHDNHASLGVSRALGYRPNGESLHARGERADVMVHMRLQHADWLASGGASEIQISGGAGPKMTTASAVAAAMVKTATAAAARRRSRDQAGLTAGGRPGGGQPAASCIGWPPRPVSRSSQSRTGASSSYPARQAGGGVPPAIAEHVGKAGRSRDVTW